MIAAIIQARVGARRLPNKTLIPIGEHTLLGWTIKAVSACPLLDQVIVLHHQHGRRQGKGGSRKSVGHSGA